MKEEPSKNDQEMKINVEGEDTEDEFMEEDDQQDKPMTEEEL